MLTGFYRIYRRMEEAGFENPLLETLRLLDIYTGGAIRRFDETGLGDATIDLESLIAARSEGVPLEYIIGRTPFMGLEFRCTPAALIPRQETELLARTALALLARIDAGHATPLVIDMGTGSGNLAVSLAVHAPHIQVLASDISADAVALARSHVEQYQLQSRVTLFCGNMFEGICGSEWGEKADLVVCNPPYIPTSSLAKMAPEVINHEPITAFDAGAYGIDIFRRLIADAPTYLKPSAYLVFEIGGGQEKFIERLLQRSGNYEDIEFYEDDEGKVRVVSARRKN